MARPSSPVPPEPGPKAAYVSGLRLLARRERSRKQLGDRLRQKGFPQDVVDAALDRLAADGALSDERFARAAARTESLIKGRGPARVQRQLEMAGIDRELVRRTLAEVFGADQEQALLIKAVDRQLRRSGGTIATVGELRRAWGALVRQGFSQTAVRTALRARSPARLARDEAE